MDLRRLVIIAIIVFPPGADSIKSGTSKPLAENPVTNKVIKRFAGRLHGSAKRTKF